MTTGHGASKPTSHIIFMILGNKKTQHIPKCLLDVLRNSEFILYRNNFMASQTKFLPQMINSPLLPPNVTH